MLFEYRLPFTMPPFDRFFGVRNIPTSLPKSADFRQIFLQQRFANFWKSPYIWKETQGIGTNLHFQYFRMLSTLSIVKRNKLHMPFCQHLRFLKRWSHALMWSENLGELKTNPRSRLFPLKTNPRWSTAGARGLNSGAQSPGEYIIWW